MFDSIITEKQVENFDNVTIEKIVIEKIKDMNWAQDESGVDIPLCLIEQADRLFQDYLNTLKERDQHRMERRS
jgi:hypothetical protein